MCIDTPVGTTGMDFQASGANVAVEDEVGMGVSPGCRVSVGEVVATRTLVVVSVSVSVAGMVAPLLQAARKTNNVTI
jgi:hypothetical protein